MHPFIHECINYLINDAPLCLCPCPRARARWAVFGSQWGAGRVKLLPRSMAHAYARSPSWCASPERADREEESNDMGPS